MESGFIRRPAALALAAATALLFGALHAGRSAETGGERHITGAWKILATVPGQPLPIGALYTFTEDGGLVTARTGFRLTGGHGRWRRVARNRYAATVW